MDQKCSLILFCALFIYYGLGEAHLIDCHCSNPAEEMARERALKEVQNQKDLETTRDENATFEEKYEALERLIKNEGIS